MSGKSHRLFKSSVSLLIFCLVVLSIRERGTVVSNHQCITKSLFLLAVISVIIQVSYSRSEKT